jgi:spore coat polysaccharide biosynthesis protein SpsF (cytidylyltransferase family)
LFRGADVDYASNNSPRSWPHGLDAEVFSAAALARAAQEATAPDEREHVTPWLRSHADIRTTSLAGPGGDLPAMRWTLDYPEDLAFFQALFAEIPTSAGFEQIVTLLRAKPEIAAINADRNIKKCA